MTGYPSKRQGVQKTLVRRGPGRPARVTRGTQTLTSWDVLRTRLREDEPVVAIDIEFQRYVLRGGGKERMRLGRISVVNFRGETVLDTFVCYREDDRCRHVKLNHFDAKYGVTPANLDPINGAQDSVLVEAAVKRIIKDRAVVLHGGNNDRGAFYHETNIWAEAQVVVDTQRLLNLGPGHMKLEVAAREQLGVTIQVGGQHDCLEDTKTTMKLFQKFLTNNHLTLSEWLQPRTASANQASSSSSHVTDTTSVENGSPPTETSPTTRQGAIVDGRDSAPENAPKTPPSSRRSKGKQRADSSVVQQRPVTPRSPPAFGDNEHAQTALTVQLSPRRGRPTVRLPGRVTRSMARPNINFYALP